MMILAQLRCSHNTRLPDIVNGQKNTITITLENKSNQNLTLLSVAGSLTHPDTNALVKNVRLRATQSKIVDLTLSVKLTSIPFGNVLLAEKLKINIPYTFYSQYVSYPSYMSIPSLT
jgi:hypothetical protein